MKITVIRDDQLVIVDGAITKVSMAGVSSNIHAIQFDTELATGEIEYKDGSQNEVITDLTDFQFLVERYNVAREKDLNPFYGLNDNLAKHKALAMRLAELDTEIAALGSDTFTYNGVEYYVDFSLIGGLNMIYDSLPSDFSIEIKTATLEEDGISNVYVTLQKEHVKIAGKLMVDRYTNRFKEIDNVKRALKLLFKEENSTYQQILDYEV